MKSKIQLEPGTTEQLIVKPTFPGAASSISNAGAVVTLAWRGRGTMGRRSKR